MQIVHGQVIGFHCFIFVEIEWPSLISIGQITELKYLKEFLPLRIKFTEGITGLNHKLMVLSLFTDN